ncbi:MAG: DUF4136 domain-containing protein [Vicinamibacteria bacterium]|nr:DUF4136 domain-containing protein [Vicinamibacteria bacterium]
MYSPTIRLGALAALAVSALALAGCASMHVSSFVEHGSDLRRYHTYNWRPAMALSTGDPRLDNNQFFDQRVRAQVERHLASQGFQKATSGVPDLLVRYHASITQKIDLSDIDREAADRADVDRRAFVYDAGTLVVDLVDARTNTLVWRGWAEGSFDGAIDNQRWMEARIDDAVARILQRLPRGL